MGFWADEVLRARDATDGSTGKYGLQDQRAPMAARDQALGWLADALGRLADALGLLAFGRRTGRSGGGAAAARRTTRGRGTWRTSKERRSRRRVSPACSSARPLNTVCCAGY